MSSKNTLQNDVVIAGTVDFESDFYCDAKIEGELNSSQGSLHLGENASVKGDVQAKGVTLQGKVEGKIKSEKCELLADSVLLGDIETNMIQMEPGAKLTGRTMVGG